MNTNTIKEKLKKEYDCNLIITMKYNNDEFAKALESKENGVWYRYFKILENQEIEEVKDDDVLSYLREMNETNTKEIYR